MNELLKIEKRASARREMAEVSQIARNNAARLKRGEVWGITENEF
jgi:hypothetical protein